MNCSAPFLILMASLNLWGDRHFDWDFTLPADIPELPEEAMLIVEAFQIIGRVLLYLYRYTHVAIALWLLFVCVAVSNDWVTRQFNGSCAAPPMSSTLSSYRQTWLWRHLSKARILSKAKAASKFAKSRLLWNSTAITWLYPTAVIWITASLPSDPALASSGVTVIRVLWFLWEICWLASILRYHMHLFQLSEPPRPEDVLSGSSYKVALRHFSLETYLLFETAFHPGLDCTVIPYWLAGISGLNLFLLLAVLIVISCSGP